MEAAEQVTDVCTFHGEGPVWDRDVLRFVDNLAGDVVTWRPADGTVERLHVGSIAAAVRPRAAGGLVVAVERGFALVEGGTVRRLRVLWSDPHLRMNDGGCDPLGRFYCGSMARPGALRRGAVYRLDVDGSVRTILRDVSISNGLAWSPDGATAYYVDSATQRIDAFAFEAGELRSRRTLVHIPRTTGIPDGITVDAEGGIWVALAGGGCVHRYGPDGTLHDTLPLPVPYVTACTFGGERLEDLYVTTSRAGRDTSAAAGAIFRLRPGVRGLPVRPYGG